MGKIGRGATIAVVIGVLALLAIVLYLILEPLHRDDDAGTGAVPLVGYAVLPGDTRYRDHRWSTSGVAGSIDWHRGTLATPSAIRPATGYGVTGQSRT